MSAPLPDATGRAAAPAGDLGAVPRLPTSPYPGLRPFLDHEDMLMHGRQAQVAEVVQRLGRRKRPLGDAAPSDAPEALAFTRFVAVIGGSGSGKSSLIRAGVVPHLRQFGIPEAGDLWEAVVATPGTNFQREADGAVHESPITRLAGKFERVLRGAHSPERCAAIAQMLRRDGGLSRLVDAYGPQLDLPASLPAPSACVLIVLDQFEELFHKTNAGSADARALVERVIDHFHEAKQGCGSQKCFLAITMRSEHLNDCAGYLGLSEAINTGGYLVGRLGEAQLREVIEKPSQRYLRLRQREGQSLARRQVPADPAAPALPRSVVFEAGVVERLLRAVGQIELDPDHLPLLQHVLARTWSAACGREGLPPQGVPAEIRQADLWRAVSAADGAPATEIDDNLLRSSLDNWAEFTLSSHPSSERPLVLDLMRRLAYRDPRTGSYSQQRLHVGSHPLGEARLHALVEGRWIDGVDYLHWDDEDPAHVTLKVSHESFIRGWKRLRQRADHEAARLELFMQLLEETARWIEQGRPDSQLLEQRLLDRLSEAQMEAALGRPGQAHDDDPDPETWVDWQSWLAQLPRGEPLKSLQRRDVRDYVARSRQALAQRARDAEQRSRDAEQQRADAAIASARRNLKRVLSGLVVLVLFFTFFVQVPVSVRAQHYFHAAALANRVSPGPAQERIGGRLHDLALSLTAADELAQAGQPSSAWSGQVWPVADAVLALPGLRKLNLAGMLPHAAGAVEPLVNDRLRRILTESVWYASRATTDPTAPPLLAVATSTGPVPIDLVDCASDRGQAQGRLLLDRSWGGPGSRGLFVTDDDGQASDGRVNRLIFSAQVQPGTGCRLGNQVRALPFHQGMPKPVVMYDDLQGHLVLGTAAENSRAEHLFEISHLRWARDAADSPADLSLIAVVFDDPAAAAELARQVGASNGVGRPAATGALQGGLAMRVHAADWRLVSNTALRLGRPDADPPLRPFGEPDPGCSALGELIRTLSSRDRDDAGPGVRVRALALPGYCLVVQQAGQASAFVSLQVFRSPVPPGRPRDAFLVTSVDFGRVPGLGADDRPGWATGAPGSALEGWLVLDRPGAQAPDRIRHGMPWSTAALAKLGRKVLNEHCTALPSVRPAEPFPEDCPAPPSSAARAEGARP